MYKFRKTMKYVGLTIMISLMVLSPFIAAGIALFVWALFGKISGVIAFFLSLWIFNSVAHLWFDEIKDGLYFLNKEHKQNLVDISNGEMSNV